MRTMLPRSFALLLPLLAVAAGCVSAPSRVAGSVPLPAGATRTLHVEAPQRKDIAIELWNRGPGRVTFRRVAPVAETTTSGALDAAGGDVRWAVTADRIAIELTADEAGATAAYAIRCAGSVTVDVRAQ